MEEYISKRKVIDALYEWSNHTITDAETWHLRQVIGDIRSMPSAQPETHDKRTETHACDCISRQAAIDALNDEYHGMISDESMKIYQIINWLNDLPSAQPECKTGRWIPQDHNHIYGNVSTCMYFPPACSECGHTGDFSMNYCPNCGCKMEVEHG